MAVLTVKRLYGPANLSNSAANVWQGANGSALIFDIITNIHVVNLTATAAWFNLFLSAVSATETAGKEFLVEQNVAAYSAFDWYGRIKLLSADYMVGHASGATTMTITLFGEQYVV